MALSWTSAIRDRVCQLVLGVVYSSARTDEKNLIDVAGSVPTGTPGGLAGERLTVVRQWAQWFEQAGASAGPDVWEHVWVREIAAHAALGLRLNNVRLFFDALDDAWETAINSYSVADASSGTLSDQTINVSMMRYHVIRHCARLTTNTGRKRRLLVPVPDIDSAVNWAINFLWNRTAWEFRTRQVLITVTSATPQTPTVGLTAPETFDSLTSRWLIYTSATDDALNGQRCLYADETMTARLKAVHGSDTGTPSHFHVEDQGNNVRYWHWMPLPDATYTLRGACLVNQPAYPTSATDSTPFTKFPPQFLPLFPDLVLAHVLKKYRVEGWQDQWREQMDVVEQVAPALDNPGTPSIESLQATDANEDWRNERSYGGGGL